MDTRPWRDLLADYDQSVLHTVDVHHDRQSRCFRHGRLLSDAEKLRHAGAVPRDLHRGMRGRRRLDGGDLNRLRPRRGSAGGAPVANKSERSVHEPANRRLFLVPKSPTRTLRPIGCARTASDTTARSTCVWYCRSLCGHRISVDKVDPLFPAYVMRDVVRLRAFLDVPFHWPRPDPVVMDLATGTYPEGAVLHME